MDFYRAIIRIRLSIHHFQVFQLVNSQLRNGKEFYIYFLSSKFLLFLIQNSYNFSQGYTVSLKFWYKDSKIIPHKYMFYVIIIMYFINCIK